MDDIFTKFGDIHEPGRLWPAFSRFLQHLPPHFYKIDVGFMDDEKKFNEILLDVETNTTGCWTTDFCSYVAFENEMDATYIKLKYG